MIAEIIKAFAELIVLGILALVVYLVYTEDIKPGLERDKKKLTIKFDGYTVPSTGRDWRSNTSTILHYLDLVKETEKEISIKLGPEKTTE